MVVLLGRICALKTSKMGTVGLLSVELESSVGEVAGGETMTGERLLDTLAGFGEIGGESVFLYGLGFWSLFVEDWEFQLFSQSLRANEHVKHKEQRATKRLLRGDGGRLP